MSEPKKSKAFNYNLGVVLHVREIFEKQEKEKFAKAVKEHQQQVDKEEEMKDYQKGMQHSLADKLKGKISDFANIMHRHEFLKKYKVDVNEQEEKTQEAEQKKEEQRERVVQSVKDVEILEKDKDHKRELWKKLMNKEETKFLDDIANSRVHAKKLELARIKKEDDERREAEEKRMRQKKKDILVKEKTEELSERNRALDEEMRNKTAI